MGVRVFVARSGWNKTPISAQEWREAAATLPELEVHAGVGAEPVRAMLRGSRQRGVVLQQGYLCGDHVNHRLVAVMFVLADRLGAQVYSERRNVYHDVADWEERMGRRGRRSRNAYALADARNSRDPASTLPSSGDMSWMGFALAGVLTVVLAAWAMN